MSHEALDAGTLKISEVNKSGIVPELFRLEQRQRTSSIHRGRRAEWGKTESRVEHIGPVFGTASRHDTCELRGTRSLVEPIRVLPFERQILVHTFAKDIERVGESLD